MNGGFDMVPMDDHRELLCQQRHWLSARHILARMVQHHRHHEGKQPMDRHLIDEAMSLLKRTE